MESVVGFCSSLSFPWLPCLLQNFLSSIHPELLKSVVIPSMIVNLGLQLSTAQSHLLVFLSVHTALLVFSCTFWLGSQARAWCCSPHTQNLTLKGQEGGILDDEYPKSRVCPRLQSVYYLSESVFRSGCFSPGRGKRREGYFSFPSCTSSRAQIGTEGWAVSPGISILSLPWLPLREACQGHSFIHPNTHAHCPLKYNQRPKRPSHSSQCSWLATMANDPTSSVLCTPSDSHGCQAWHAMTLWHCRNHSGCPKKRLWKQLLADEKFMQCYNIFEYPRLILCPSLWLLSFWMMHRWHTSQYSTWVWGSFVSDLWENINVVCAVWDGSNYSVKGGIFIWVHKHWIVGILMWHWQDVPSNRPVQKTWEGSSESTIEEDMD